jgi:hypothetical protein
VRELHLDRVARQCEGMSNRLVFFGLEACGDLLSPAPRSYPAVAAEALVLATISAERAAGELGRAGFIRERRDGDNELWRSPDGLRLRLYPSDEASPESEAGMAREYGVLLTRHRMTSSGLRIRAAAAPVAFLLWWLDHRAGKRPAWDSVRAEDLVELVARHDAFAAELATMPDEVSLAVRRACATFAAEADSRTVIEQALLEARTTAGFTAMVLRRFADLGRAA